MPEYTFRIRREQMIDRVVEAPDREQAFINAQCGDNGADYPYDPHDTIIECTTPRRGRRPKGDNNND